MVFFTGTLGKKTVFPISTYFNFQILFMPSLGKRTHYKGWTSCFNVNLDWIADALMRKDTWFRTMNTITTMVF